MNISRNILSISHVGAMLFGISASSMGCAFMNVPLTMPTAHDVPNTIPGGRGREIVVASPFADKRAIQDRCGMQKNGYNMDTADAKCLTDPSEWMAQYLAVELRAFGFSVLPPDAAHRPGAVRIDGTLLKLFVEPVIGWWTGSLETDLSVRLVATSETGLRAERTFFVKGVKKGVAVGTPDSFHESLNLAARSCAAEMVQALIELLDRYPQLGALQHGSRLAFLVWEVQV